MGKHLKQVPEPLNIQLVISSPLTRTLETLAGAFGVPHSQSDGAEPLLMRATSRSPGVRTAHSAILSESVPPVIAWEGCREHYGSHPCDKRRSLSYFRDAFPAVDFSLVSVPDARDFTSFADDASLWFVCINFQYACLLPGDQAPCNSRNQHRQAPAKGISSAVQGIGPLQVESEEDVLWTTEARETDAQVAARGSSFMQWLMQRPESRIAVVSHSSFLYNMLLGFGHGAVPLVRGELHRKFQNCEMRSVVVADLGGGGGLDPAWWPGGQQLQGWQSTGMPLKEAQQQATHAAIKAVGVE